MHREKKRHMFLRIITYIVAILLVITVVIPTSKQNGYYVHADTIQAQVTIGVSGLNFRTGPGTGYPCIYHNGSAIKLSGGMNLIIVDNSVAGWYKVTINYSNTEYTGYVSADYVTIINGQLQISDAFEQELAAQGFPESYRIPLRALHAAHPSWNFVAVQTGLDWNTVIENERSKQGQAKNLIQCTASNPQYSYRATEIGYNWSTDTWSPYDGSNWYAASDGIVKYYMDPRNFLDEKYIFQFESLNYVAGAQTQNGVEVLLAGSFMANKAPTGYSQKYSAIVLQAGADSKVSPYHIASRILQEVGKSGSGAVTGTNSTYPGIYNFYNIGAYDSADGTALLKGLKWASVSGTYGRPWNSPYKSIYGGAQMLSENYIAKGQNTLYTQKFNVVYRGNLYSHQYMSNVQAPTSEVRNTYTTYATSGMSNSALCFNIPVYNNMPDQACAKPANNGNPNNWLKNLSVSGYTLTPTFAVNNTQNYALIVENAVNSVMISASTVNANAKITGTGTVSLQEGNNVIPITVTAQNGDARTYSITIVRKASGNNGGSPTITTAYRIQNGLLSNVSPATDVATFTKNLGAPAGATVQVKKADGSAQTGRIGTGNTVSITSSGTTLTYTVILYGDVNGDGEITALDLLKVQKHITGAAKLTGVYEMAANVKKSGSVSALDLLKVQKHLIGAAEIAQ